MRTHTVREALNIAAKRNVRLEALTERGLKTRECAEAKVPAGGLLVKTEDGLFVALTCVTRRIRIEDSDG